MAANKLGPASTATLMVVTALFGAAGAGCKKSTSVSRTAYIVGPTNDIIPAKGDAEARVEPPVMNAAVLIATRLQGKRIKFCSGTLINGETGADTYRVLTNHHCFAVIDDEGKATETLTAEACTETKAYFGFLPGRTAESTAIGCALGSLRTNFDGDVAVFTLQKNPPERYLPIELWDGDEAAEGREALIVHFPDVAENMEVPPGGSVKLPTAAVTLTDCKVLGTFPVGEWDLDRTLPFSLRHTCDLIHGSSGSGLIDVQTGKLLGVNWGGIKISYDEGQRTDNVATRASFAAAFLSGNVDEKIREAEAKRASASSLSAVRGGEGNKASGGAVDKGFTKGCGVLGDDRDGASVWLAFALALPLTSALRVRRRPAEQRIR